mmetsp:Transcript_15048/g.47306  ORF Transcript_15048/g.47306 Transcript_15048/m.47306 type:complete len:108 (+) Transcript_15048:699-1022(+)
MGCARATAANEQRQQAQLKPCDPRRRHWRQPAQSKRCTAAYWLGTFVFAVRLAAALPANTSLPAIETDKLTASDAADYDYFGKSVAISGDLIVIGADADDDAGEQSD